MADYEGSETITTTPHSLPNDSTTLTPITVDGTFQAFIDFNAVVAGADEFELNVYEKVRSADSQELVYGPISITSPQVLVVPPLQLRHGWDYVITKISGTDRAITWSIRQEGARAVDGAYSADDALRLLLAIGAGKASGMGTTTGVIRDINDTKNRISATQDADGNRSAFGTLDLT